MKLVISNFETSSKSFLDRVHLIHGDVTEQNVDAIAMVVPQSLDYKGGVSARIIEAAGQNMDEFILEHVYKPKAGEVYALPAFNLPARHILMGVLPVFRTEFDMRDADLSGVVRKMMDLARCMLLKSVAFPALSCEKGEYPKPKSARLVCHGILDRMQENFEDIRIVCDNAEMYALYDEKLRSAGWGG